MVKFQNISSRWLGNGLYGVTYFIPNFTKYETEKYLEFGLSESSKLVHQYAIFYDKKAVTVEHDSQWISFFKNSISEKFELFVVDGPLGSDHISRSEILEFIPNGITDSFCIFMDDANRQGEKETLCLICDRLKKNGIKYVQTQYFGVKGCAVICSEDLKFLCSLS